MRLQSRTPLWMRFDLVGLNNPAIEDARLIAGFFLAIATHPGLGNRPSGPEQGSLSASTVGVIASKTTGSRA